MLDVLTTLTRQAHSDVRSSALSTPTALPTKARNTLDLAMSMIVDVFDD